MKTKEIKTIDINCLEWFDKVNGNSYFAGSVTVNYGMKDQRVINMPLQYGYGSAYECEAIRVLFNAGLLSSLPSMYELKEMGVIIRSSIAHNCKKRELKMFE